MGRLLRPLLLMAAAWSALALPVRADEDAGEALARVTAPTVALRSGPGAGFRTVRVAERGQVFPVRERASVGYWLKLRLPDSTYAWVPGDAVYVYELGEQETERAWVKKVFAPPPLQDARGEVAIGFGALDTAGLLTVRPTWLLAPSFGFELTGGAAVSSAGRTFLGGAGAIVNLFADRPVVPFAVVGGGLAFSTPNSDSFVLEDGTSSLLYAGGGLRFSFKYRLTLRLESRSVVFFAADRHIAQQEVSGGLTVFF